MAEATVDKTAYIGPGVVLSENVFVGPRARIGEGSVIRRGAVIYPDTIIGSRVYIYENAVLGREPRGVGSMTRPPRLDLPALKIGDGCVVGACAVLYRGTTIGSDTLIGDLSSVREECEIGSGVILARGVTVNYGTRICNRVKIMDNSHITGQMLIEDGVFIGPLVSTANDNTLDRVKHGSGAFRGPHIRLGASVGAGASLLPNIVIGEYAVVSAGAVVSYDVPPRKIVAGAPARVVKDVPAEWINPV